MNSYIYKIKYENLKNHDNREFYLKSDLPQARDAIVLAYDQLEERKIEGIVMSAELIGVCWN